MRKLVLFLTAFVLCTISFAQNSLVINGAAFVTMSNGTVASPVYIVVNQANVAGIARIGVTGWIISEGDGNFVQWNNGATASGTYVFPFGKSTTDYIPFTFAKTAGATDISVSTYSTGSDNTTFSSGVTSMGSTWGGSAIGSVIDRWWRVNATGNTADMTFSYIGTPENSTTTTPTGLTKPQQWDNAVGIKAWLAPIGAGAAGVTGAIGTVTSGSTTSFSADKIAWVLTREATPLPIELVSFSGECKSNKVMLHWSTASETNNNYFTIERSNDGITFQAIATVNGAGNSSSILNYSFSDNNPISTGGYYRLKQTDYNGDSKISSVIFVAACSDNTNSIDIYSDGGHDYTLLITSNVKGLYSVILYNTLGQIIYSQEVNVSEGINRFLIPLENIDSAMYFVNVNNGKEKSFTKKITISHY